MKLFIIIPLISLFIQSLASPVMAGDWKNSFMYETLPMIKLVSNRIQEFCPVDQCVVVGVGRSPTPFIAQLKIRHENYAWNLPLSSFRFKMNDVNDFNILTREELEELNQHFDTYLPTEAERRGRNILLVDFAASGLSLVAAKNYLNRYFDLRFEKNPADRPELEAFAITTQSTGPSLEPSLKLFCVVERGSLLGAALTTQKFDEFAEFGSFNIIMKDRPAQPWRNPEYDTMLSEMKACR